VSPPLPPPRNGRRVRMVEDHPADLYVYRVALSRAGARVQAVTDGPLALAALTAGLPFDAVLIDLMLPGVRGTEVVARMRADGFGGTIVGFSGYLTAELADLWAACGCDAVVEKNAGVEAVIAALAAGRASG